MSIQHYPKIQQIAEEGYQFDLGTYISRGIDIFKKNVWGFVGYTVVFFLILVVTAVVPILGIFAMYALTPILFAGFYIVAHKLDQDENVDFGDFFKGFEKSGQLILWYLVMMLGIALLMTPMFVAMFASLATLDLTSNLDNPFWIFAAIPVWSFLLIIPIIYLSISWRWAPMFIVFYDMNFWDAMEASRRITNKKWWMNFLFAFLLYLFSIVGYLGLLVGILFTIPAALCMDYAAFADVTRLDGELETDNIEEHLVE